MKLTSSRQKQQGFLTLVTVVLIVIVGFIAVALAYISFGSDFATINLQKSTSALYLAESALEDGTHELFSPTLTQRSACAGLSISNNAFGDGMYTLTTTGPFYTSSATTLNGALTASATSITVNSTANYQSSGRIMIDRELINYMATDATHFLFAQRGADGTVAASHVSGTRVGQYQCGLTATGGAPKLIYNSGDPGGKRILNESAQLQEAWAVGNTSSSTLTLMRWNRPTELTWNNAAITGSFNLEGIYMISYVDGWAVGASSNFLRWNGSSWSTVATGLAGSSYLSVFCNASNDCHAVGPNRRLGRWNGTAWSNLNPSGSVASTDLNSVNCSASSDCWTVGSSAGGGRFYNWNGSGWVGNNVSSLSAFPYNGVFCNSSTDCWAVGANATFARKSGANWTNFSTGMPSAQYNGIYCTSADDCWAVGNTSGGQNLKVHWDGNNWTRNTSSPTPSVNLNAVSCLNENDCWAVGAASGGDPVFLHWDGTSWVAFATAALPNVAANAISLLGPKTQPASAWSEDYS